MNTFRKLPDGNWGVMVPMNENHRTGASVTVTLRDGRTKQVTLAQPVGTYLDSEIFAVEATPKTKPPTKDVGDLSGVYSLFEKARKHLKFPAIVLSVPKADMTIRLNVAGPRAKVPGSITVLDANKGDDGRDWFGRITSDGAFQPSNALNGRGDAVVERLKQFACDPVKVAGEHGKLTGACCFCNLPLKDERSTEVGYGPVCARNYGLPWGSK